MLAISLYWTELKKFKWLGTPYHASWNNDHVYFLKEQLFKSSFHFGSPLYANLSAWYRASRTPDSVLRIPTVYWVSQPHTSVHGSIKRRIRATTVNITTTQIWDSTSQTLNDSFWPMRRKGKWLYVCGMWREVRVRIGASATIFMKIILFALLPDLSP